jgi:RNA polymerase primary sigma factor
LVQALEKRQNNPISIWVIGIFCQVDPILLLASVKVILNTLRILLVREDLFMNRLTTHLGKKVFLEQNTISAYMSDIKGFEILTKKQECELAAHIHKGNPAALKILIESNLRFVVAVCRNYVKQGIPLADLINEGNVGLIRAARRFEGSKNIRFISYAVWWIRQGILDALSRQSRTVTIPLSCSMGIYKINNATRKLTQSLGRPPSIEELEFETGINANHIKNCLRLSESTLSLNHDLEKFGGREFQDSLFESTQIDSETLIEQEKTRSILAEMLYRLNGRERVILQLYFGLDSGVTSSLRDIGNKFGLSRERVRQIKNQGLANLSRVLDLSGEKTNFA